MDILPYEEIHIMTFPNYSGEATLTLERRVKELLSLLWNR